MIVLNPELDLREFFGRAARATRRVLLLDYDGTLAPLQVQRHPPPPYPGVLAVLERIMERPSTDIALVTGRRARDLEASLSLRRRPEIWGSHGVERLHADGRLETFDLPPEALQALSGERARIELSDVADLFECKPAGIALHGRGVAAPRFERVLEETRRHWNALASPSKLMVQEFDGGLELRVADRHKGHVVERVLSASPEGSVAAFLGDDMSDEAAFEAIAGYGIAVLVRETLRDTRADLWLRPPQDVLAFLDRWYELDGGRR